MNENSEPVTDENDLVSRAITEYLEAIDNGISFDQEAWLKRYSTVRKSLLEFIAMDRKLAGRQINKEQNEIPELDATIDVPTSDKSTHQLSDGLSKSIRNKIGPYQLRRVLGSGGMGTVYEAIDPNGNLVALKLLSSKWSHSSASLQRFKQEGKIASAINHPRCVFVKAVDEDQGVPYIVMELMTGKTLKDLVKDQGPIPISKAVPIILDILDGLQETHAFGMIHRDLKPGNCYLESSGRVKLGDFGLARSIELDSELTTKGEFLGTPLFASPEQIKGETLDVRSDIYSVCATFYYLLTGQAPFAGNTSTSLIAKLVSEDPVSIRSLNPQVPPLLEHVIMRGLQRDRADRYQTVVELRQALEPFLVGKGAVAAWGRRLTAYFIDSIIFGIIISTFVALMFPQVYSQDISLTEGNLLRNYLLALIPSALFWYGFEGLGRQSPGKWLMKLQIIDCRTGSQARRSKLLLRTTVVLFLSTWSDTLFFAMWSRNPNPLLVLFQWLGYFITFLITISPIFFIRRYRMLFHDWLSQTMVANRPNVALGQLLARAAADYKIPQLSPLAYPKKLGEFQIDGLICSTDSKALLVGHDPKLSRTIWIFLRPVSEQDLPAARRVCDRATRMRWLTSGVEGPWRWDAFLAFEGAPLKHWTSPDAPLDWQAAKGVLFQIAQELEQSEVDGSQVRLFSLEQVWMDSRGRVALIDWCTTEFTDQKYETPSNSYQEKALLCETARLALTGRNLPLNGEHPAISAIVPVQAQKLLKSLCTDKVKSAEKKEFSTSAFLSSLESQLNSPAVPSYENRLLGLLLICLPGMFVMGLALFLIRIGNIYVLKDLSQKMVAPAVTEWLLRDENQEIYKRFSAVHNLPTREELKNWIAQSDERQRLLAERYNTRLHNSGIVGPFLSPSFELNPDPLSQLSKITIQSRPDSNQLEIVNWGNQEAITVVEDSTWREIAALPTGERELDVREIPFPWLLFSSLIPYTLWIFCSLITGGGLSLRFSGLAIVSREGKLLPFYKRWLRIVIAWLPFLILQALITWIDCYQVRFLWFAAIAGNVLLVLFLLYAIFIVVFPRRSPHDWLLGTHLVLR
jgi:serine/threonine protein kinase